MSTVDNIRSKKLHLLNKLPTTFLDLPEENASVERSSAPSKASTMATIQRRRRLTELHPGVARVPAVGLPLSPPDTNGQADDAMIVDSDGEAAPTTRARSSRKRPAPVDDVEEDDDALLPAAAAMKRRRLEEEADARRRGVSTDHAASRPQTKSLTPAPRPAKKKKPPIDIEEAVRERRRAEEEAAARDADAPQTIDDLTVEEMQQLAVVEEMDLPARLPARTNGARKQDRWDACWNGRKNFKRFRRKGEPTARRGQTVMVPLEPAFTSGDRQRQKAEQERSWRESIKSMRSSGRGRRRALPKEDEDAEEDVEGGEEGEGSARQTFTSAQSQLDGDGDDEEEVEVPAEFVPEGERQVVEVTAKAPRPAAGKKTTAPAAGVKRPPAKGAKGVPAKRQRVYESDSGDSMQFQYQGDSSDEEE